MSVPQFFSYEDDGMAAFVAGVSEEMDIAADAFRGIAVVTFSVCLAWGVDVSTSEAAKPITQALLAGSYALCAGS